MTEENQVDTLLHKKRDGKRIVLAEGKVPMAKRRPIGRLPRITRYMALAIYYEDLIRQGHVYERRDRHAWACHASTSNANNEPAIVSS